MLIATIFMYSKLRYSLRLICPIYISLNILNIQIKDTSTHVKIYVSYPPHFSYYNKNGNGNIFATMLLPHPDHP